MDAAKERMDAAFEFITKMNIPFYCFHDTDVVGDGSVFEIEKRLEKMVDVCKTKTGSFRRKTALGNGQRFFQSALHERRRNKSRLQRDYQCGSSD
jgi:xylose isomerase